MRCSKEMGVDEIVKVDQPKRKYRPRVKVPALASETAIAPVLESEAAPLPPVVKKAAAPGRPAAKKVAAPVPPVAEPVAEIAAAPVPEQVAAPLEAPVAQAPEPEEIIEAVSSPVVRSDVTEAPAMPAPMEEVQKMATIETPSLEKAQAMFGDVSERIKSAFEKSTKVGEEMVELAKGNVEAVVASAKVAAKGGETLGQEAAEYGKKSFESTMALFKSFAQVRTPSELFQLQSDYAKASLESAVAEASKVSESLLRLAGDVVQPLSNRYAVASEKMKSVTL